MKKSTTFSLRLHCFFLLLASLVNELSEWFSKGAILVHLYSPNCHEHIAGLHLPRIEADVADLDGKVAV